MKWNRIDLPALTTNRSTVEAQPLTRDQWTKWAREKTEFSGAWYSPVASSVAASTTALSTASVQAYVDFERTASEDPRLRYYRCFYARLADGRVFQSGPSKNLEYERHRYERPSWFLSCTAPSTT